MQLAQVRDRGIQMLEHLLCDRGVERRGGERAVEQLAEHRGEALLAAELDLALVHLDARGAPTRLLRLVEHRAPAAAEVE